MKKFIKAIVYWDESGRYNTYNDDDRYIIKYEGDEYYVQYDYYDDIYDVCLIETDELVNSFKDLNSAIDLIDSMEG